MRNLARLLIRHSPYFVSKLALLISLGPLSGLAAEPVSASATGPEALNWTAQQDHKNMMEQLGITRLRPGPSGQPGATNSANYDPAKANPFPDLPDVLALKSGQNIASAAIIAWANKFLHHVPPNSPQQ